jgi:hypothetical protein
MRTAQCSTCLRYRGSLECDAFPRGIPEDILTGQADHTKPYEGDSGKRYKAVPGTTLTKSEDEVEAVVDNINELTAKEDRAYRRAKDVLIRRGYAAEDFEEGGVLYGYSTNELIEMGRAG